MSSQKSRKRTKSNVKRKEIINIRGEINDKENRKTIEKNHEN